MPTTKIVRVPGAVAVVFHEANDSLVSERIYMHGPISCLSYASEAHDVDFEPGQEEMKLKAMNHREAMGILGQSVLGTQAHVFADGDGRGEPTVTETIKAVNDALAPPRQGFIERMRQRFG